MSKSTIIFRADGGPSIGMGHFTRTLALAEMLNQHFHCIFATRQPTEYQIAEIEKICHSRIDLPEDDAHFEKFLTHLKGDEIVVLDNYYFTTEYQKAIKSKGCKLVCIDDMHDKHFVADVVINHAEGVEKSVYSKESYTQLLLGFQYALLRKEFREPHQLRGEKEFSGLIMMGGTDPLGITDKILYSLSEIEMHKPVAVVANTKSAYRNTVWFQKQSSTQIADLMEKAEFGILSASTVALEACAVRLPFICGYFVDNQKDIYNGIEKNNLAVCVGDLNKFQVTQLREAVKIICLKDRYDSIIKQQTEMMDNQTDKRLLKIFQEL
jgi:UDP-2,4-diacetamido-2,4,6-trideoxy-beta-L-altropyranose hydrolase